MQKSEVMVDQWICDSTYFTNGVGAISRESELLSTWTLVSDTTVPTRRDSRGITLIETSLLCFGSICTRVSASRAGGMGGIYVKTGLSSSVDINEAENI